MEGGLNAACYFHGRDCVISLSKLHSLDNLLLLHRNFHIHLLLKTVGHKLVLLALLNFFRMKAALPLEHSVRLS